jgi:uncharacterized protein YukE
MKLDRLRADWRERPLPAMLDAFQAAHTAEDWPLATALQLELERLLALGPSAKGLTEGAEVFAGNTGRIRAALAAAKQRRAAMVEPVTRETVQRHKARVSELEAALQGREGLLYEIKQRGAYPMQGFSSLRR